MSHNGIGLQTPRGSGTSGYVQKSLSERRNEGYRRKREREADEEKRRQAKVRTVDARRGAGTEIIAHDQKRWIELKCLELRDSLEDKDVEDEKIEQQVKALREKLTLRGNKKSEESGEEVNKKKQEENGEEGQSHQAKEENPSPLVNDKSKPSEKTPDKDTIKDATKPTATKTASALPYNYVPRFADR